MNFKLDSDHTYVVKETNELEYQAYEAIESGYLAPLKPFVA